MQPEKTAKLCPSISPKIAKTIRQKPKMSWRFNGTISINHTLRKIDIKIPVFKKVKVLLMLDIGKLKYLAISPITIPVTIINEPVSAYDKKLIHVRRLRFVFVIAKPENVLIENNVMNAINSYYIEL
ncbi:hypothetical protein VAS14_05868 [Photobacterium angustum S14]|uniref:Uncharacterized protein n=1 Tax=Photobacterium angustum (strain S14 / CCUG 15956) TaxID=314292 RepID=Q1ZRV4_PHOAS|nr:hypothetical protein VAS14_05868 [Photobacterium angustum S14]